MFCTRRSSGFARRIKRLSISAFDNALFVKAFDLSDRKSMLFQHVIGICVVFRSATDYSSWVSLESGDHVDLLDHGIGYRVIRLDKDLTRLVMRVVEHHLVRHMGADRHAHGAERRIYLFDGALCAPGIQRSSEFRSPCRKRLIQTLRTRRTRNGRICAQGLEIGIVREPEELHQLLNGPESTDVTGNIELENGVEMVMPGDNAKFIIELITPIAMDEGLRFAIREGGRTVGAGVVSKIIA